jgi:hypothetical protein
MDQSQLDFHQIEHDVHIEGSLEATYRALIAINSW